MFDWLFKKKSSEFPHPIEAQCNYARRLSYDVMRELERPRIASYDYMNLFYNVPEVFFPIDYISNRIAGANFVLKRTNDDSIVWNRKEINSILTNPNSLMRWNEFVYMHFVHKLCTGNSYVRAAMADSFVNAEKWRYCTNFWVLPSMAVDVEMKADMPLFGIAERDEIIKDYKLNYGWGKNLIIPTWQIWHDRDLIPNVKNSTNFLKSESRLKSMHKAISNLIAVYEARNVIYTKRGGLGFLINQKQDEAGTVAMTEEEKKEIIEQHFDKYGVQDGQLPYGLTDVPLGFVRTNLSISELQPFDETLADAITIAGAYSIPSVLVPRKDQSTFSNQASAEKSVYSSVVIPLCKQFCKEFTAFIGLEDSKLYLDCDFSHIDCMQQGLSENEDVKTKINTRCKEQFTCGLITLNDWRAQIKESRVENVLFDKLKFDMTDAELDLINKIINSQKTNEDEGRNQEPAVQDEGK